MKKINLLFPTLLLTTTGGCVLPLVSCGPDNYQMSELTKDIIKEMVGNEQEGIDGICSIARPSKHCNGIAMYLCNRIREIGTDITCAIDEYNNVYADIPANNPQNKDYDWIILQGHIDMVVAGLTEEEALTQGIEPEIEGRLMHSKGYKTSLGADNGIGVSMILELIKKRNTFEHGPIRCIFTADEEVGLIGAHYIDESVMYSDREQTKLIPYLLNADAEKEGDIYRSCTGNFLDQYYRNYLVGKTEPICKNAIDVKLDGLKGGHSGIDIVFGRANADRILFEFLDYLTNEKKIDIQLAAYDHIKQVDGKDVDIKWETNQLIENGHMQFFTNKAISEISGLWDEYTATLPNRYPGEDLNSWKTSFTKFDWTENSPFINKQETANLAKVIGSNHANVETQTEPDPAQGMPYGVFAWKDEESKTPAASGNIGPISIRKGFDPDNSEIIQFSMRNLVRTAIYGVAPEGNADAPKWSAGWMEPRYNEACTPHEIIVVQESGYQPWQYDEVKGNPMVDFLKQTYTDMGVEYHIVDSKGGVEPAEWITKNPNLICSCIGAQIDGAHTVEETLHLDTIDAVYNAIVKVLTEMVVKK